MWQQAEACVYRSVLATRHAQSDLKWPITVALVPSYYVSAALLLSRHEAVFKLCHPNRRDVEGLCQRPQHCSNACTSLIHISR